MKTEKIIGLLIGIILSLATIGITLFIPKPKALEFFAIFLAGIAAVYFGYAVSSKKKEDMLVEIPHTLLYFPVIFLGLWVSPYFLVVGYLWHGVWDLIHHPKISIVKTNVPEWYIYGCALYDWIIAVFIWIWVI